MDETLRQLGELLLGSIPTIVLLVLLYGLYTVLVHKPLSLVLAERRKRTEGTLERAQADIAAAETRTAEYEQRLREARAAVFKKQDERREQALQVRGELVDQARTRGQHLVEEARAGLEKDRAAAEVDLQKEGSRLAEEIIRAVLQPAMAPPSAGGRQ